MYVSCVYINDCVRMYVYWCVCDDGWMDFMLCVMNEPFFMGKYVELHHRKTQYS